MANQQFLFVPALVHKGGDTWINLRHVIAFKRETLYYGDAQTIILNAGFEFNSNSKIIQIVKTDEFTRPDPPDPGFIGE